MHAAKTTMLDKLCWGLLAPGERVLAAVSGGPDSLSLLHALWTAGTAHGLGTVEAAHLDHGLRGEESAAEARWVAEWCVERGIICHVGFADVAALASERKLSMQEAARSARYAFLDETAAAMGAEVIATGHTQDDQVETVLGNILRGTGVDGLRGIPERRGKYVRPLLDVSRAEIEAYCAAHSLTPRQDPSNLATDHYTRNRIRLELLPELRHEFNPGIDNALLRLSEIAARDSDYLTKQAAAALIQSTHFYQDSRIVLKRNALAALHPALLRYVVRLAYTRLRGTATGVSYELLETLCQAILTQPGLKYVTVPRPPCFSLTLPFPMCDVLIDEGYVYLILTQKVTTPSVISVSLSVPGEATLSEIGWTVTAGFAEAPAGQPPRPNSGELEREEKPCHVTPPLPELGFMEVGIREPFLDAYFDADTIDISSLTLRNWRSGDRIDPLGMGGHHKKVSDIFTGAKVPRSERHKVPIVADALGIVWIVGHTVAERARVTDSTRRRLFLSATRQEQETG